MASKELDRLEKEARPLLIAFVLDAFKHAERMPLSVLMVARMVQNLLTKNRKGGTPDGPGEGKAGNQG